MIPGIAERRSFDQTWHGTAHLFAVLKNIIGMVSGKLVR